MERTREKMKTLETQPRKKGRIHVTEVYPTERSQKRSVPSRCECQGKEPRKKEGMQDTNDDADPDLKRQDDEGQDTLALYHFFDQVAEAKK
eukprot:scaffold461_cov321-Pavlova_lutheri.AAC.5